MKQVVKLEVTLEFDVLRSINQDALNELEMTVRESLLHTATSSSEGLCPNDASGFTDAIHVEAVSITKEEK